MWEKMVNLYENLSPIEKKEPKEKGPSILEQGILELERYSRHEVEIKEPFASSSKSKEEDEPSNTLD